MTESKTYERISRRRGADIAAKILGNAGYSQGHVEVMARNMVEAQAQECHSHGLYRLIACSTMAEAGLVNLMATPKVTDRAPSVVAADAKGGNSLLAFQSGAEWLVEKAQASGIAALAINNCFHYSALWWEVEQLSGQGMVALAMTPTHPHVAPFGGTQPLLGTNPIAFSWPRPDGEPYTFDFATSSVARGDVELRSRQGETLPEGWAIDAAGQPTTGSTKALAGALLPFGRHKGSAISTMVELLAGPLIGDLLSYQTAEPGSSEGKVSSCTESWSSQSIPTASASPSQPPNVSSKRLPDRALACRLNAGGQRNETPRKRDFSFPRNCVPISRSEWREGRYPRTKRDDSFGAIDDVRTRLQADTADLRPRKRPIPNRAIAALTEILRPEIDGLFISSLTPR